MSITDIYGDITYNNPGKETWVTPIETDDLLKHDHEDSMTKNGDIYTYVKKYILRRW